MATTERVTVTLTSDLIAGIDRFERNRSRFIAAAVKHELLRRKREALLTSLASPHREVSELDDTGLTEWGASLPVGDERLVDEATGTAVRWVDSRTSHADADELFDELRASVRAHLT